MEVVREIPPRHEAQLHRTLVRGVDELHYLVTALRLYDDEVREGRPNYDLTVSACDENGNRMSLVQPWGKKFPKKEALAGAYENLLAGFDTALGLQAKPRPKPAAAANSGPPSQPEAARDAAGTTAS